MLKAVSLMSTPLMNMPHGVMHACHIIHGALPMLVIDGSLAQNKCLSELL